jgi:hypothetical protein
MFEIDIVCDRLRRRWIYSLAAAAPKGNLVGVDVFF